MDKLGGVGPRHHPLPFPKIPPNFGPHSGSRRHVPRCGPGEYTVWESKPLTAFFSREDVFLEGGAGPPRVFTEHRNLRAAGNTSRGTLGGGTPDKRLRGRSRGPGSHRARLSRGDLTGLCGSRASSKVHWNWGRPTGGFAPRTGYLVQRTSIGCRLREFLPCLCGRLGGPQNAIFRCEIRLEVVARGDPERPVGSRSGPCGPTAHAGSRSGWSAGDQ